MHVNPGVLAFKMNGAGSLQTFSVKEHGSVAGLHAQHAAGVMPGLFGQKRLAAYHKKDLRRVETRISHKRNDKKSKFLGL